MSLENKLWGAPHIHGEFPRLGFTVAQSTVAKYMAKPGDGVYQIKPDEAFGTHRHQALSSGLAWLMNSA